MSESGELRIPSLSVAVTTPRMATHTQRELAHALADFFDAPYVLRRDRNMGQVFELTHADVVIVADDPMRMFHRDGDSPMFFHPSMAAQRIEREARGERDRLLRAANIQVGDSVVDATLGLAADALVLANAVGDTGRVMGIETVPLVARMLQAVQRFGSMAYSHAAQLLQRVEIVQASHVDWLLIQPDNSVDVVYFDPMFRAPAEASSSFAPLRPFAHGEALSDCAVEEAKRVARRCVVVKERPMSGLFHRHGLVPDQPRRKIAYGVWQK